MENYEENNQNINNNQNSNDNSTAIVSMVLGIISVVLCSIPLIGLILGIISLVCATKGLKKSKTVNKGKGFSIAGISCGTVGIVLNIVYTILWIFVGFIVKDTYESIETLNENRNNTLNKYKSTYNDIYNFNTNTILDDYDI